MNDRFIELPMSLCQMDMLKPMIDKARSSRHNIIFVSAAPNLPDPYWKLQCCMLWAKATSRITKIIRDEIIEK
jgi:hypothetical protein